MRNAWNIKACPSCGHDDILMVEGYDVEIEDMATYRLQCPRCGCFGPSSYLSVHHARRLWNMYAVGEIVSREVTRQWLRHGYRYH